MGQLYELIHPIQPKYDLAVKVALARCLKYLVVDSEESANICREFLKEKQLRRDVLVLQNIPEK
jgi:chromosome segregation ATPase